MKAVLQRVETASVKVADELVGRIDRGWLVYLGVGAEDEEGDADWLIRRILGLRLLKDASGGEVCLVDGDNAVLVISQFTLFANCRKGAKPSWHRAAHPSKGKALYDYFLQKLREHSSPVAVAAGEFGADMKVHSINDGPITLLLDSRAKNGT